MFGCFMFQCFVIGIFGCIGVYQFEFFDIECNVDGIFGWGFDDCVICD